MNRIFSIGLCLLMLWATRATAGDHCCPKCGCQNVKKVCRLICDKEEIDVPRWKCECEDFCIPGPSHKCGKHCECDCGEPSGKWCFNLWNPSRCAEVRTRVLLLPDKEKKVVPTYKWVVETVCDHCGPCGQTAPVEGEVPPVPAPADAVITPEDAESCEPVAQGSAPSRAERQAAAVSKPRAKPSLQKALFPFLSK